MLRKQLIPFVMVASPNQSDPDRSVFTNDRDMCWEMTRYLASLGHERTGYIIGHPDHGAVGAFTEKAPGCRSPESGNRSHGFYPLDTGDQRFELRVHELAVGEVAILHLAVVVDCE